MLPDGGRDGPGSATDVMPAFARGHLGEADGSMSTPSSPSPTPPPPITTAGSLLNPPWGGGCTWPVTCFLHTVSHILNTLVVQIDYFAKDFRLS